ncbi:MAG TPA: GTPase ObgE [Acidimicrobiia bacterium]|nr:GTPase ObgE [Acidimicrobiia bacterium]
MSASTSFVDQVEVELRGGNGGAGVAAFARMAGKPRGKPSGGSGGRGGDVVLRADPEMGTLLDYLRRPHRIAAHGAHGQGDNRNGKRGEDLVLSVPAGTVVRQPDGTVVADLVDLDQRFVAAEGGRGGRGNAALVTPRHRAPGYAEQGEYGEVVRLVLEMKLLADAALVGFPNAGKSTLISAVSAARPKVADYPFTTLEPHLGVVEIDDRQFVMADVPGLIEGAAEGRGLGHEFLRHVERARALVVLLDPLQERPAEQQLEVLLSELERYSVELSRRPRVIALNKADALDPDEAKRLAGKLPSSIHVISAATRQGLAKLLHAIADAVEEARREAPERVGYQLHRPLGAGFTVRREGATWVVEGRGAMRAVSFDDLTRPAAADRAAGRLARLGVDEALRRAGALPGDEVRIGDLVFEFEEDDK